MKRVTLQRSVLSLGAAVVAVAPLKGAVHGASLAKYAARSPSVAAQTFRGSLEQMQQWGPIRVSIVVASKKITKVVVNASSHTDRSVSIQGRAIPLLKKETLKAQSAKIQEVSGATDTSGAYITSLQSAVKRAKTAKALR